MTASAPQVAYELVQSPPEIRVYRAPRAQFFGATAIPGAKTWTRVTNLKVESWKPTSGPTPAPATLRMDLQSADTSLAAPLNIEVITDLGPRGTNGQVAVPKGWRRWDAVKLVSVKNSSSDDESESCEYVGFMADWEIDLATGQISMYFEDWRRPAQGTLIWGERWYNTSTSQPVWLAKAIPIFNPKGKGNRYRYSDTAVDGRNLAFVDPEDGAAATWKRGHIWNYLRRVYGTNPETSDSAWPSASVLSFIDWPEAVANGFGKELFGVGASSYEAALPTWAIGGMSIVQGMDMLIRKRADLDWTSEYDGSTGRGRPRFYGTGATTINTDAGKKSLRWSDVDKTPAQAQPEVPAGRLRCTAEKTATRVRGLGARKLFDMTFKTTGGSDATLEEDWTSANEVSWVTLMDGEDETASQKYPDVFRRWRVKSTIDWKTLFGWPVNIVRTRTGESYLQSFDAGDKALRIRCLVWRSKDSGATWEICPEEMRPMISDGKLGVEFPEGARHEREWSEFEDAEYWTWNGDTTTPAAYDMRVTICVEADERLGCWEGTQPADWPLLEQLLQDEGYQYRARRKAILRTLGGNVSRNGTTDSAEMGATSDDEIYNDTYSTSGSRVSEETRLRSAVAALASQNGRVNWSGDINLKNLRIDLKVGDYLERLVAGGSTGERPDLPLHTVVRSITFHVADGQEAVTTVSVESY